MGPLITIIYEFMETMLKSQMMEMLENYMNADSYKNSNLDIPYSGKFGMLRNKRDSGDAIRNIELGDKLVAKINSYKDSRVAEIGNMTCVLREVGVLNVENQVDTQLLKQKLVSGDFGQVNVGQVKYFMKCYYQHHAKLC